MERFLVRGLGGKKKLKGAVSIGGAKNDALKAMAATILFDGPLTLDNIPQIEDVRKMTEILSRLGGEVERTDRHSYKINTSKLKTTEIDPDLSKQIRASIVLIGPILTRYGEVTFPHPGGDVIGERPIDLFLEGFKKMGAKVGEKNDRYTLSTKKKLKGTELIFRLQSVGATETFMMAGTLAEGETVIKNAAMEPEIVHLAEFLNSCGASIEGAGTPTIRIKGGKILKAARKTYHTLPDRIETGSFLILGALCAEELVLLNCNPSDLEVVITSLKDAGVPIKVGKRSLTIHGNTKKNSEFKGFNIKTHEYPGFPTDLQAPATVFLTQASGEASVFETIFEGRLNYSDDLVRMGASIKLWNPHQMVVEGPRTLYGKELDGPDIRAGLAYLIAGLVAKGDSVINNVHHIDRGYERIEERLGALGASIERLSM